LKGLFISLFLENNIFHKKNYNKKENHLSPTTTTSSMMNIKKNVSGKLKNYN